LTVRAKHRVRRHQEPFGPPSRKGRKGVVELCGGTDLYSQQDRLRRLHCIARRRDLWRMQRIAGIDEDSDTRQARHELTQQIKLL